MPYTLRISLARASAGTETMAQFSSPDLALSKDAKISTKDDASASEQWKVVVPDPGPKQNQKKSETIRKNPGEAASRRESLKNHEKSIKTNKIYENQWKSLENQGKSKKIKGESEKITKKSPKICKKSPGLLKSSALISIRPLRIFQKCHSETKNYFPESYFFLS